MLYLCDLSLHNSLIKTDGISLIFYCAKDVHRIMSNMIKEFIWDNPYSLESGLPPAFLDFEENNK